jgi:DNA-binding MarR family transcriptional regulator
LIQPDAPLVRTRSASARPKGGICIDPVDLGRLDCSENVQMSRFHDQTPFGDEISSTNDCPVTTDRNPVPERRSRTGIRMVWQDADGRLDRLGGSRTRMAERYQEVLVALRRIMRATDLYSKQLSKTAGLTSPQLLILAAVRDLGDVTIGTVARQVRLSQATVTTILDRLERRGLVYRERSTVDKRKVHAHLTELGEAVLADAPTPLQQSFIERFQGLDDWEQSMIMAALQRVADMMDAGDIDASPVLHVGTIERLHDPGGESSLGLDDREDDPAAAGAGA